MNFKFRKLRANEIDVRVASVSAKGVSLLLYKDARCDMNILDETVGAMNWQREHQLIGERLYCTVSIYNENSGIWISKQDVGTESYAEKEKGQASDSFKRACFNWGLVENYIQLHSFGLKLKILKYLQETMENFHVLMDL